MADRSLILMAEEAFTQLVRRIGKGVKFDVDGAAKELSDAGDFNKESLLPKWLSSQIGQNFSNSRQTYRDLYIKTTGKTIPAGQVVIPKQLHERLTEAIKIKKSKEARAASMTELDRAFAEFSKKPGGQPRAAIGEKGSPTFQNNGWMPTLKGSQRRLPKAEINKAKEIVQRELRAFEELLSMSGKKASNVSEEAIEELLQRGEGIPTVRELTQPERFRPRYRYRK